MSAAIESGDVLTQRWEQIGSNLSVLMNEYMDLCVAIGINPPSGISPKALTARIDCALSSLHVRLDQQLIKATSALARTRNTLNSRIHTLPAEVLSEIFTNVIYPPRVARYQLQLPMPDHLVQIYRSLHCLLAVCSRWRAVGLSQANLWTIVPLMNPMTSPVGLNRSLLATTIRSISRAQEADLHLAAIITNGYERADRDEWAKCLPRFRSINVLASSHSVPGFLLSDFWESEFSGRLKELAIYCKPEGFRCEEIPPSFEYMFWISPAGQESFERLIRTLSVIKLRHLLLKWDRITFSHQLVELELSGTNLGYDSELAKVLVALSSASELRDLRFISILTFRIPNNQELEWHEGPEEPEPERYVTIDLDISIPKLENLTLRDLYSNTLTLILSSINSRSHKTTLHLTSKTFEIRRPGDSTAYQIRKAPVIEAFRRSESNVLLLDGGYRTHWVSEEEIREIMEAIPRLQNLLMRSWGYDEELCKALQRHDDVTLFPRLNSMSLLDAKIWDEDAFKAMVTSHSESLRQIILAGSVSSYPRSSSGDDSDESMERDTSNESSNTRFSLEWKTIKQSDELAIWLKGKIPSFELKEYSAIELDFQDPAWVLW